MIFCFSFYFTSFLLTTDGASQEKGALPNGRPGMTQTSVTKIKTNLVRKELFPCYEFLKASLGKAAA